MKGFIDMQPASAEISMNLKTSSGPSIKMQRWTVKGLSLVLEIPIFDHHFFLIPSKGPLNIVQFVMKFLKAVKVDYDFPLQGPEFVKKTTLL